MGGEPRGRGPRPNYDATFYARKRREDVVPDDYVPGDIARSVGGEDVPMIDAAAMDQAHREQIRKDGGVDFIMVTGEGDHQSSEAVTALLRFTPKGKGRVEISRAVGHSFNSVDGKPVSFAPDMSDAPEGLRAAVLQQADMFAQQQRSIEDFTGQQRAVRELAAQVKAAVLQSEAAQAAAAVREVPKQPISVETKPTINKVEAVGKAARVEVPPAVASVLEKPGAILLVDGRTLPPKVAAARFEPIVAGVNIVGWTIAEVVGDTAVVAGRRYETRLADMPGFMRKAIDFTQRAIGTQDKLLQQMYDLQVKTPYMRPRREAAAGAGETGVGSEEHTPPAGVTDFPEEDRPDVNWRNEPIDRRTRSGKLRAADADESIR